MRRALGALHAACCLSLCFLGCKDTGADKVTPPAPRAPPAAIAAALDRRAVLAAVPDDEEPAPPPPSSRFGLHSSAPEPKQGFVFSGRGGGVAFVVERGDEVQVVHNDRAGARYAAVGPIALSPDGRRSAHGALRGGKWRMVVDGKEGEPFSAVRAPVFSPDGAHVAYQAMAGERWHLVMDATANAGTPTRYLQHEFSGDSSRIAFIDDAGDDDLGRLVVSDLAFHAQTVIDPRVSSMVVDVTRSRLAAVAASEGRQRVLEVALDKPGAAERGPTYDAVHDLVFGPDGTSLAYVAERSGSVVVVLEGREAPLAPGERMAGPPVVRPDGRAVGALVASGGAVRFRELFADGGRAEAVYDEADGLVYDGDGRSHAYAARRGAAWFVVVDGKEGPPFDRVVTPSFSPDGKHLLYRARRSGRRFVVVADRNGKTTRQHPAYEQVFPVLFTGDGKSAAYGVKDGRQLVWSVEAL